MDEQLKKNAIQWLIKADNDLKTAEHGLTADEPITDTICFHCQQVTGLSRSALWNYLQSRPKPVSNKTPPTLYHMLYGY